MALFVMPPRSPRRTMQVLPEQSLDADLELSRDYNTAATVGSAWTSLQLDIPKLPWEHDFWSGFLDLTKSAMDLFHKGYKRPMPFHFEGNATASTESEAERRVVSKSFSGLQSFIKHIKDVTEESWQEERDALW